MERRIHKILPPFRRMAQHEVQFSIVTILYLFEAVCVALRNATPLAHLIESAINYRPPSIIGRARALTLAATNKLIIAKDRWVNVG